MANIGALAVQLSIDAALFTSGLDRSTKEGKAFASTITKTFSGIGAGVAGLEGIGGGAASFYQGYKSGLKEIIDTGEEAKKLGVGLNALAGLQLAAGDKWEATSRAMFRFEAELSKAAHGSKTAAVPFQELKLDIDKLSAMRPDQAFGSVVDKLNALGNAGDRASKIKDLFGRQGIDGIDKFDKGLQGINDNIAKIASHGGVGFDMKGVETAKAASESIREMESTFNRIKLSLISEFAPVMKNVADGIADMVGKAGGGKAAFQSLADGATDFLVGMLKGMERVGETVGSIVDQVKSVTDQLPGAKSSDKSFSWLAPSWSDRGVFGQLGLSQVVSETFFPEPLDISGTGKGQSSLGKAAHSGLDSIIAAMEKSKKERHKLFEDHANMPGLALGEDMTKIKELSDKLQSQLATYGMVGEAAERYRLALDGMSVSLLKGVDAGIAELTTLRDLDESVGRGSTTFQQMTDKIGRLDALHDAGKVVAGFTGEMAKLHKELGKKMDLEFNKIADAARSPLGKLQDQMEELNHLRNVGDSLGNKLTGAQYASALSKDFLAMSPFMTAQHAPGALEFGSNEARSAEVSWQRQGDGDSLQEQIKAGIDRLAETEKQHLAVSRVIAALLPDLLQGRSMNDQ